MKTRKSCGNHVQQRIFLPEIIDRYATNPLLLKNKKNLKKEVVTVLKMKRGIAWLLLVLMLAGMLPLQTFALDELSEEDELPVVSMVTIVNPLYADVITEADLLPVEDAPMAAIDDYHTSLTAAAAEVAQAMKNRQKTIVIGYQTKTLNDAVVNEIVELAFAHTGEPGCGDNLKFQHAGVSAAYSRSRTGGVYYYTVTMTASYMTTAAQEAKVDAAVAALRSELGLSGKSDEEKIRLIYNWMCDNITYDYAGLADDSNLLEYTAYNAIVNKTAVCQGYANLLYRLLLEEGIDCRIISGDGNGEPHAWNIVKMGNWYYYLDATWDAAAGCAYFMKGSRNFTKDHTADGEYAGAFAAAHPINTEDYAMTVRTGTCGNGVNWALDNMGNLTISGSGAIADYTSYSETPWFPYYSSITKLVIEPGITAIGDYAFQVIPFTEAKIGKDVTAIGEYAFGSCRSLTTLNLPGSVETLGMAAFFDCPALNKVIFCGTEQQWAAMDKNYANEPLTTATLQYHNYVNNVCTGCGATNCAAVGHTWQAATCSAPKTCAACGATEGSALGHTWADATCTEPKTCSVCGETEGSANGHSWIAADCEVAKTCGVCGTTEGAALGHDWNAATCTTPKTCSVCGAAEGNALGHTWADATCTEPKTCSVCGETEGSAKGHSWVAADCHFPKTCSVCGATEGAPNDHTWADATCTTPKTCTACDATEGAALGHNYENGSCTRCGDTFQTASGKCGDNLTWTLDGMGVLTVSGTGAMYAYSEENPAPWQNLGVRISSITVGSGVTSIGSYAFYECGADTVSLPNTLKTIGSYALAYNDMTELVIPEGVTSVGDHAISDCSNLTELMLPSTLKTIGTYAFARTRMQILELPDSVTSMGVGAFYSCPKLEGVYISRSLKTISERAFMYCQNLQLVIMPGSVTMVEDYAFSNCDDLFLVYYLGTNDEVNDITFGSGNYDILRADWYMLTVATKDPEDVTTSAGTTATFSTAASRSNVDYQWYYLAPGSEEWIPCTGDSATKATYSVIVTEEMDGYLFLCIMTDEYGNEFNCDYATLTVLPAPEITKQPQSVEVKSGETASVTVEATGIDLTYTWYYTTDGTTTKFYKSSVTTATYTTTMDATRDGRRVYCVITDKYGSSVTTDTVTLSMEKTPLVITQQPQNVSVGAGVTAKVTVKASGDGLTYTWYYKNPGAAKFSASSTTTATYSAVMDTTRDGRQVYCVITDRYGRSVTTETATMTMEKTPLVITQQPADVTVVNGASAKTTVKATGDGLKYTWYFTSGGSSAKFSKSSATSATYSTTMNADRSGRQVYCVITDAYGRSVTSETATLYMKEAIKITAQPQNVKVPANQTATVTVEAEGEGLTYTWYYANKGKTTFTKSSYTTNTYSTIMDATRDGRRVYCKITDKLGNSVKTVTVTMTMHTPLVITQQPANVMAAEGAKAATTVKAEGDGLKYAWYYTSGGSSTTFSKSSITTATYSTTMDTARDGRQVYCVITDKHGDSVTTNTVTLSMKPRTPLVITQQPANVSVGSGATAKTTVKAEGDGLTYAWYFTTNAADTTFSKSSTTTASYSTTMDASRDGRKVYCIVTDQYGNTAKTNTVTLSMEKTPLAITQQPTDVTVAKGAKAATTVKATGDGLKYTWYYTSGGSSTTFSKSSITSATYSTTMDATRNGRRVYCVITDAYGRSVTTNTVTLSMAQSSTGTPLKIVTQPTSVTVANGKTAKATVVAQGDGLTYEWYYTSNGTATKFYKSSTTTATYSTTMDSSRDGRQIYCVITDQYGNTVTTNTVTLKMS